MNVSDKQSDKTADQIESSKDDKQKASTLHHTHRHVHMPMQQRHERTFAHAHGAKEKQAVEEINKKQFSVVFEERNNGAFEGRKIPITSIPGA